MKVCKSCGEIIEEEDPPCIIGIDFIDYYHTSCADKTSAISINRNEIKYGERVIEGEEEIV